MKNRIDYYRAKDRRTYREIAIAAGLSAMYVHELAKGKKTNPSRGVMAAIAQALGRRMDQVFPTGAPA